jgi:hypothetical protein
MFSHSNSPLSPSSSAGISLRDLLDDRHGFLSDYFSLSVTRLGENTVISLTTTGSDPITYSTVISSTADIDVQSLVFVAQHDRRGV